MIDELNYELKIKEIEKRLHNIINKNHLKITFSGNGKYTAEELVTNIIKSHT